MTTEKISGRKDRGMPKRNDAVLYKTVALGKFEHN